MKATLAAADRQRMESVARQDLMDSSDDEKDEEGNSVLTDYGRYCVVCLGTGSLYRKERTWSFLPQNPLF